MKKRAFLILFILFTFTGYGQHPFSFPEGIHPGIAKDSFEQNGYKERRNSRFLWRYDTLDIYAGETSLFFESGILKKIYWEYLTRNLDAGESDHLITAAIEQVAYFSRIYGEPIEQRVNKLPENFLRQWCPIVTAEWKLKDGTLKLDLRYLTRIFEDPKEVEDGTYDREFEFTIIYH